jgi:hypothetical protein
MGMSKTAQKPPLRNACLAVPADKPITDPKRAAETEHLSLVVTGFKLTVRGRALLVLALGAAAIGGTIVIKLLIF